MVPSDESPINSITPVYPGVTSNPDGASKVSEPNDEANNNTGDKKNESVESSDSSQLTNHDFTGERGPLGERMLESFELGLARIRERALHDHTKRMNIVRALARSSGMDNQQQDNFVKEIDKLFHPPFIE